MTQELKLDVIKFLFLNTFPAIAIVNETLIIIKQCSQNFLTLQLPSVIASMNNVL